jgi:P-type conjugative transfer protein TrbG
MKVSIAALLASLPIVAHAQGVQVPPLMGQYNANSASDATGARASASASVASVNLGSQQQGGAVPSYMPPPVQVLSPSAPLTAKEKHGTAIVQRWKNRRVMPSPDANGTVRYAYGASIPSLVCSPLFVCAIELQPGEIVQNLTIGDKPEWTMLPGIVGSGANMTSVITVKPHDAGLITNVQVLTDRRTYSIILKSTQTQWMPKIAFSYPEDQDAAWANYQAKATSVAAVASASNTVYDANFRLSGDNPAWKPRRVLTDGKKTYIEFPPDALHAQVPTLVGLIDQGWFSKDAEQQVNYRSWGNQIVVDQVISKAALVYGVGGQQTKVVIERQAAR